MANTYSIALTGSSQQYLTNSSNSFYVTSSMTLEAWVKPSGLGGAQTIISLENDQANQRAYRFWLDGSKLAFIQWSGSDSSSNYETSPGAIPNDGAWHHVAIVFDASVPAIYLYIDGSLNTTFSPSGSSGTTSPTGNPAFKIGARGASGNLDNFDGKIDDVRVWTMARTASNISVNYMRELAGNEANLLAYYTFDNTYNDKTANGLNLSVGGVPSFSTDVPFTDSTTTSTTTTTTSTSTSTTTTSTSTTTTSTSTTTSTTTTMTSTSTSSTSTSTTTTSTSTSTTTTSTSTSTSTSTTSTLTTAPQAYFFTVERVK